MDFARRGHGIKWTLTASCVSSASSATAGHYTANTRSEGVSNDKNHWAKYIAFEFLCNCAL